MRSAYVIKIELNTKLIFTDLEDNSATPLVDVIRDISNGGHDTPSYLFYKHHVQEYTVVQLNDIHL